MLERTKQPVYRCHKLRKGEDGYMQGFDTFSKPVKCWMSLKGIGGESILSVGGEINSKNLVSRVKNGGTNFHVNDFYYIGIIPPQEHNPSVCTANYRVSYVSSSNGITEIVFEKLVDHA